MTRKFTAILVSLLMAFGVVSLSASPAQATGSVDCGGTDGNGTGVIGFYDTVYDDLAITCMSQAAPRGLCLRVEPDNVTSFITNGTNYAWYIYGTANCTSTRTIIYGREWIGYGTRYRDNWVGSAYRTACAYPSRSC